MRYLLDTHTYLWFRKEPGRLPARTFDIITGPVHDVSISAVVPWEIAIKTGSGKMDAKALLPGFEEKEMAAGFTISAITVDQVIQSGLLPRYHRDPFDRLLIAQCVDLNAPILSRDRVFDLYGVQRIWD